MFSAKLEGWETVCTEAFVKDENLNPMHIGFGIDLLHGAHNLVFHGKGNTAIFVDITFPGIVSRKRHLRVSIKTLEQPT